MLRPNRTCPATAVVGVCVLLAFGGSTQLGSQGRPTANSRRVIGLLDIPTISASQGFGNPPKSASSSASIALPVFAQPNAEKPFLIVTRPDEIEMRARDYDVLSAVVYGSVRGWFEIGLRQSKQRTGWIAAKHAGTYFDLRRLFADGLLFMTAAWDRHLFSEPRRMSLARLVPGEVKRMPNDDNSDLQASDPHDASLLEMRTIGTELWIRIEVGENACELNPRMVASGWVPAHAPSGHLNVWFYAAGC